MSAWLAALVVVAALAVSAVGGWAATVGVFRLASRSPDAGRLGQTGAGGAGQPGYPTATARAVGKGSGPPAGPAASLRGGTWIGLLERLAITGALLAGYPAAIAFVIAIKGLGRYPELREHPEDSERFVIGSLTSMLWAAMVGLGGFALLGGAIIPG